MKNIFIAAIMLLTISAKAQLGSALIGVGSTLFVGSSVYYIVGEPKRPTQVTQTSFLEYNDKMDQYKKLRTVSMVSSSMVLLTGIIFKATEVKVSKTTSVSVAPTGAALTLRW